MGREFTAIDKRIMCKYELYCFTPLPPFLPPLAFRQIVSKAILLDTSSDRV